MKQMRKQLTNKRSILRAKVIELILKGYKDKDICGKVGLNYHLFRYYLTNYNKELRVLLSKTRQMRRAYQHEHTMRRELYKVKCKDEYKKRRERKLWYKLL